MIAELVQIAAMAQRMAEDVCRINGTIDPKDCKHPAWDDSKLLAMPDTGRIFTALHCPDCGVWYERDNPQWSEG